MLLGCSLVDTLQLAEVDVENLLGTVWSLVAEVINAILNELIHSCVPLIG